MRRSLSRRRLLAASVPGLLAGCLVESDESAAGSGAGGESEDADGPGGEESAGGEAPAESEESAGDEASGDDSTTDEATAEQTDDEPAPDEVGPDGSGLVVSSADVRDVTDDGYETTVDARLAVENRGRFTYGTVELRVDAYPAPPNSTKGDSVGGAYVTRRFTSGNRFDDGTRRFDVSITFRSRETNVPADVDWYEVDAAVRTADPV